MNTHVVTKPLPKGRRTLAVGTKVNASTWRNVRPLEEQRYIRPLQPDERTPRVGRKGEDESRD